MAVVTRTTPYTSWVVGVVHFGRVTRTSTLGHLTHGALADGDDRVHIPTLCGIELAAATDPPESFVRCQRCIDARSGL